MGFTKLDEGILQSSIMFEPATTFKVWIALLASCREDGVSPVSSVYLASVCHLPLSAIDKALAVLEQPDERSRSTNDEGRRVERVDGGYYIINYFKYREFSYSSRKDAVRKREYRDRVKDESGDTLGHVPFSTGHSASVLSESDINSSPNPNLNLIPNPVDVRSVQLLIDLMLENNPGSSTIAKLTPARQAKWIAQARLLRTEDKRTPEQIEAVVRFSQADPFWRQNILSMPKLREKWDQLVMKARGKDKLNGIREWLNEDTREANHEPER